MKFSKEKTSLLILSITAFMLLNISATFKLTHEELKDLHSLHPSFLQTKTSLKATTETEDKLQLQKNKLKMQLKTKQSSCSCKPPNGPSIQSSSGSNSSTPPPFSTSSNSECVTDGTNPYVPQPPAPSSGSSSPSSSSSSSGDGTGACNSDKKSTNALGKIGPLSFAITKPPYKLFSCDQVLIIEGQTFVNPRDYNVRKVAVFTLSVYMLNEFNSKNGDTMTNHMLLENINGLPDNIFGAPSCLNFIDTKAMNRIVLCLNSKSEADDIKEVFMDFMKCRMGDNLKDVSAEDVNRVFETACLGKRLKMVKDNGGDAKLLTFLSPFFPVEKGPEVPSNAPNGGKPFGEFNPFYSLKPPGSEIPIKEEKTADPGNANAFNLGNRY